MESNMSNIAMIFLSFAQLKGGIAMDSTLFRNSTFGGDKEMIPVFNSMLSSMDAWQHQQLSQPCFGVFLEPATFSDGKIAFIDGDNP